MDKQATRPVDDMEFMVRVVIADPNVEMEVVQRLLIAQAIGGTYWETFRSVILGFCDSMKQS